MKVRKLKVSRVIRKFKRLGTPMKVSFEEVLDIASKRHKKRGESLP